MTHAITSLAEMSRPELEQALATERARMQQLMLRLHGVSSALHEMTEALSGLLVLHIESKPVQVYERLNALAARYVRSVDAQTLALLAQAAGQVH